MPAPVRIGPLHNCSWSRPVALSKTDLFSCTIVPVADNVVVVITSEHTEGLGSPGPLAARTNQRGFSYQVSAAASEAKAPRQR
jgi:hypothetical protein